MLLSVNHFEINVKTIISDLIEIKNTKKIRTYLMSYEYYDIYLKTPEHMETLLLHSWILWDIAITKIFEDNKRTLPSKMEHVISPCFHYFTIALFTLIISIFSLFEAKNMKVCLCMHALRVSSCWINPNDRLKLSVNERTLKLLGSAHSEV